MNKLSRFLILAIAASSFLFVFSQQSNGSYFSRKELTISRLKPGEKIDNMVLATGVEGAFPLWSVCAPKKVNDHSITADCGELSYDNLIIGHTLGVTELVDPSVGWEGLNWELSLDGHPIDLQAFGVYDFVHPDFPSKPSPFREVFMVVRVWDVVLVNPTPGTHILRGWAQSSNGAETYTWTVDFTVTTPLKGGETQNLILKPVTTS